MCESDSMHTLVAFRLEITNTCYELYLEVDVSMKLWCLLEPSRAQGDNVGLSRLGKADFEECCYSPTID